MEENAKQTIALNVAINYFRAWNDKNFKAVAELLADDIRFEMPINTYTTKQEFLEAVRFTANASLGSQLQAKFANENEALLLYDLELPHVGKMRIAEYCMVKNAKITAIWHVHDTAMLRSSGFDKTNDNEKVVSKTLGK